MSIKFSAHVVYGVPIDYATVCDFRDDHEFEWEEIYDNWGINPDYVYGSSDEFILGFYIENADGGEFVEFDHLAEPPEEDINELRKVLEYLGIKKEPKWLLMCQIS